MTQSFTVNTGQTNTFNPTDRVYNVANYNLTASTNSSFPLTHTSTTTGVCTVTSSGLVDLLNVGVCTITVAQASGVSRGMPYGPATVTKSFNVSAVPETVNFPMLPEWRLYEGNEITPAAVTNSGLAVTYTSMTPDVCAIAGSKITVVKLGKCIVHASAAAGTSTSSTKYGAAADVVRAFFITDTKPPATFTPTNTRTRTPTQTPTPIPFLRKKGAIGASFVLGLLFTTAWLPGA